MSRGAGIRDTDGGLKCPACGSAKMFVADTRIASGHIRRRRKCEACNHRATTYEVIDQQGDPAGTKVGDALQLRTQLMKLDPDTRLMVRKLIARLAAVASEAPVVAPAPATVAEEDIPT